MEDLSEYYIGVLAGVQAQVRANHPELFDEDGIVRGNNRYTYLEEVAKLLTQVEHVTDPEDDGL